MSKRFLLIFLTAILLILFFMACPVKPEIPVDDDGEDGSSSAGISSNSVSSSSTSSTSSVSSNSTSSSSSETINVTDMVLWVDVWPIEDSTTGSVIYYVNASIDRESDENTPMFNDAVITVNGITLVLDDSYGENGYFSYEGSGLVLTTGNTVTFNVSHPAINTISEVLTVPQYVTTLNTSVSIDTYQAQATPTNLTLSWSSVSCNYYVPHIIMIVGGMSSGMGTWITDLSYEFLPEDIEDVPDYIGFDVATYNEVWEFNSNGDYDFTVQSQHTPYISNEPAKSIIKNIINRNSAVRSSRSLKRSIINRQGRTRK